MRQKKLWRIGTSKTVYEQIKDGLKEAIRYEQGMCETVTTRKANDENEVEKTITFSVEKELLEQFEAVCAELGLTVEDATAAFFEAVVQDRTILTAMLEDDHI